ncbi:stress-responsive transcription factor hsf1 [Mortierella alpina]|nr:stress-responsive transcription factor hsf1 [Mortierella alpina]
MLVIDHVDTINGSMNPTNIIPGSWTPSNVSSHGNEDMESGGRSADTLSPSARPALGFTSTAQGLQQLQNNEQFSEAFLARFFSLVPGSPSAVALAQTNYGAHRLADSTSSNIINTTGGQATASQPVQPLTQQAAKVRGHVPAFLAKLYKMVGDAGCNNLIKWSDDGQSFLILNHVEFAKVVLPKFFRHNSFQTYVRQLNMYGFHKVLSDAKTEQWEFRNPHFQKNKPDQLYLVSRKRASAGYENKSVLAV